MAGRDSAVTPFTVKARRRNGTTTYLCPDADWALRKRSHFEHMGYDEIRVTDANGRDIEGLELERLAADAARTALVES